MKNPCRRFGIFLVLAVCLSFAAAGSTHAQGWRLIGVSGQQGNGDVAKYPDRMLFEINPATAALTQLFETTMIPDTQCVGFCPTNGLLYHAAGVETWSDDPTETYDVQRVDPDPVGMGFMDSHYLETVNLATREFKAIYNANPPPSPDPALSAWGLVAPRPSWVIPTERRLSTQTAPSYGDRGTNEYHAIRGMAWSNEKKLFYISDEQGIFTLTPDGDCKFLARPTFPTSAKNNEAKGIAFVTISNVVHLLVGHRNDGYLMEINPDTGAVVREIELLPPIGGGDPTLSFGGVLGLAQHPVTGVLYAIRKTSDPLKRELVRIVFAPDFASADTILVGSLNMHMTSMVFVAPPPPKIESTTRNGSNLTLTWSGGTPPYQVQSRSNIVTGTWSNVGSATTQTTASVPISGSEGYFRISSQ